MELVLALMLQLLKFCIIGLAVATQGSKGSIISPSPIFLPVIPPGTGTDGPVDHRVSWGNNAPRLPSNPDAALHLHPSPIELTPSYKIVPSPSTVQGNMPPSVKASPPQWKAPVVGPPDASTPIAPAPVAIPSGSGRSKYSPVEHGNLAPNIDDRNANKSHTADPVFPTPAATPSTNFPKKSSRRQPTERRSFPPKEGTNKGQSPEPVLPAPVAANLPKVSPVGQPSESGSLPPNVQQRNAHMGHTLQPVSPVAMPPATCMENSTASRSTQHGSSPAYVRQRSTDKVHSPEPVSPKFVASPPMAHPIFPTRSPSLLPATSPSSAFPVNPPMVPAVSPSTSPGRAASIPSPMSTPSRIINPERGGAPVTAPLYKAPKPIPAVVHSPVQAPAAQKSRQTHDAPEPSTSSPTSPSNKEKHFPALTPSVSFYKHHHARNIIPSPTPASSYMVSRPTSRHQDSATSPSLSPTGGQRHLAPQHLNSISPSSSPVHSTISRVSPAPSPSIKVDPHPAKISPSGSSSKSPKTPLLPQVQALPPPPPNEDCLSTVCTDPYVTSPPGSPCRCVWPVRVGLRLSISLYNFFPLVSQLASEIATGVFMKQSQVRIMGANAANQQPDKTVILIDLVPLGEKFDYTTAFLTSDRFWHKKVVIKSSYFGEYDVLYVNYPGLPPSPPLPPSSIAMIDGDPYSTDGNNGRTIKPLGVDIQKKKHRGEHSRGIIAIIAVSVFLAVVLCTAAAWVMFKFRDNVSQPTATPRLSAPSLTKATGTATGSLTGDGGVGSASSSFQSSIAAYTASAKTFSMSDIEKATDNFHASRIVGEGGFGLVYSGVLGEGTEVAVKVLKREDHQGDREFLAEVEMLSRLHHRNLVKLIGICAEDSFRCLVYELIPNGSLESHLHGADMEKSSLDWGARMKIALGAARGLAYLHEDSSPHVIHRDFKSSNILLEDDFTPKVSDFGLARTTSDENRHISTRVMGTFGYLAPEYAMTGHLLVKSDVYSYGVVLLELLTGRKPVDISQPPGQENLVAWARPFLTSKEGLEAILDPSLGADVPFDSVAKVAAIASMCVQPEVSNRPFMGEVVQALKLVCNECEEAKEDAGSRSWSQEDLYIVLDVGVSNISGQLSDNFQSQSNLDSGVVDVERGLSASEIFSSDRSGRVESGSFRRKSYSGPLGTGRCRQLWQIMRRLSGGSVSEHGAMFK